VPTSTFCVSALSMPHETKTSPVTQVLRYRFIKCAEEPLLHRHRAPRERRSVVNFCSGAHSFRTVFLKPDADRYLTQLRTIADRTVTTQETWLSAAPMVDSTPIPHRRVDVDLLRSILEATRKNARLESATSR